MKASYLLSRGGSWRGMFDVGEDVVFDGRGRRAGFVSKLSRESDNQIEILTDSRAREAIIEMRYQIETVPGGKSVVNKIIE